MNPPDKIVARYLNGGTLEGNLIRFNPAGKTLSVQTPLEERDVKFSDLKAVFFIRKREAAPYGEAFLKPGGKKIRVTFADGEEIDGYSYGLHPMEDGFYMFPINREDRNERIYVIRKNAIRVRTEIM